MAFAAKKLYLPGAVDLADIAETLPSDRAVALEQGGTGVRATGASDADRANSVLQTWGMLDSGLLVPRALLPAATGASSGAAGAKGAVPAPAAGDQRRAFRGDATFATELEISSVTKADGTKLTDFEAVGDSADRIYIAAAGSGGHKARLGARSAVDADVDVQLEPSGLGSVTRFGDPCLQTMRPPRMLIARPFGAVFDSIGFEPPSVRSPGTAPIALTTADGNYLSLTFDQAGGNPAGFSIASVTQRRHDPALYMVFRTALLQSRFWFGLLSGDPAALDSLGSIKGVAVRYNDASDSNHWQFVTSNGSTQTTTDTGVTVTANAITAIRLRHTSAVGTWEFATYNFTNQAWENFVTQSSNSPAASDTLGLWGTLTNSGGATNRALSPKVVALFSA